MCLGEHYPVGRRWRNKFFRSAKLFMQAENRFIFGGYRYDFSSGVSQLTFESRANGYIFKLVGKNNSFMLLAGPHAYGQGLGWHGHPDWPSRLGRHDSDGLARTA